MLALSLGSCSGQSSHSFLYQWLKADEKTLANQGIVPGLYQGFGMQTTAGSGRHLNPPKAKILKVTTLKPFGPGSYYQALKAEGPRTIVFEVSGAIKYPEQSTVVINSDYLTVAGQTAPGKGVAIYGLQHVVRANHVLFEHLRFRAGDMGTAKKVNKKGWTQFSEWDCFKIGGDYIVFKNCTFSWATDELVQTTGNHISFYRCLFMEGLNSPKHHKGQHSKGLILFNQSGYDGDSLAVIQNIFLSCQDRNPQLGGPIGVVIVNNFIANAKFGIGVVHSPKGGPKATITHNVMQNVWKNPLRYVPRPAHTRGQVYFGPHLIYGTLIESPWTYGQKPIFLREAPGWEGKPGYNRAEEPPLNLVNYTMLSVQDLKPFLEDKVGAFPKQRDASELRLFSTVWKNGEGAIPKSVEEAGGWPQLPELQVKLDVPSKPFELAANGYTHLENFLTMHRLSVEQ